MGLGPDFDIIYLLVLFFPFICPCQQLPWLPLPSRSQALMLLMQTFAITLQLQQRQISTTMAIPHFPLLLFHFISPPCLCLPMTPSITQVFFISLALFSPFLPSSPPCPLPTHCTVAFFSSFPCFHLFSLSSFFPPTL